jgi:hypothetical protein
MRRHQRYMRRKRRVFDMQRELVRALREALWFVRRNELTDEDRLRAQELTDRVGVVVDLENERRHRRMYVH